jgi:hypothetical protein
MIYLCLDTATNPTAMLFPPFKNYVLLSFCLDAVTKIQNVPLLLLDTPHYDNSILARLQQSFRTDTVVCIPECDIQQMTE